MRRSAWPALALIVAACAGRAPPSHTGRGREARAGEPAPAAGRVDRDPASDVTVAGATPATASPAAWKPWADRFRIELRAAAGDLAACAETPDVASCACGVLCALRTEPLPGGATRLVLTWPGGGYRVSLRADGQVDACDMKGRDTTAAPGSPAPCTR